MRLIVCFLLLLPSLASASLPAAVPQKRGDFAFYYAERYTPTQLAWYSRFNIVSTGSFLPPQQVRSLHQAGSKLVYYEWTVAFYLPTGAESAAWGAALLRRHPEWLLNPDRPLFGNAGAGDIPAYYYDPFSPEFRTWRARHLIEEARSHHYDGVFFDTTGFSSVHPDAREAFSRRHPGVRYDNCVAELLKELKRSAPDLIVFTNQGYRNASDYLPYADYDLSESYMTTSGGGPRSTVYLEGIGYTQVAETYVHPWNDPANPGDSVAWYCHALIDEPIRQHQYRARICHLNYGQPRYEATDKITGIAGRRATVFRKVVDREALYYSLAAALLMGQSSYYSALPDLCADDAYFADLGRPLGEAYVWDRRRQIAWRLFENGIAVVNASGQETDLSIDDRSLPRMARGLWDVFAGRACLSFTVQHIIHIPTSRYEASGRIAPAGRIYLYMRPMGGDRFMAKR